MQPLHPHKVSIVFLVEVVYYLFCLAFYSCVLVFLKVFIKGAVYIFVYSTIASLYPSSSLFMNTNTLKYVGLAPTGVARRRMSLIITPTSRVPSNCICSFVCFLCVCFSVFVVVDDICLLSPGVGNIWQ